MANDMDMLRDIEELKEMKRFKHARVLEDLFSYKYGLGESIYKTEKEFEEAKRDYEKKYGSLDNYV